MPKPRGDYYLVMIEILDWLPTYLDGAKCKEIEKNVLKISKSQGWEIEDKDGSPLFFSIVHIDGENFPLSVLACFSKRIMASF